MVIGLRIFGLVFEASAIAVSTLMSIYWLSRDQMLFGLTAAIVGAIFVGRILLVITGRREPFTMAHSRKEPK